MSSTENWPGKHEQHPRQYVDQFSAQSLLEEVLLREIIEAEDEGIGAGEYKGGGSGVMQEGIGGACSGDDGKGGA